MWDISSVGGDAKRGTRGVFFDQNPSIDSRTKQISRTAFFHLRNKCIAKITNFLSQNDSEKLVHAFVSFSLDYSNSLLSGCTSKSLRLWLLFYYLKHEKEILFLLFQPLCIGFQ